MVTEKKWTVLYDKYPDLFENRHKGPLESCLSFGIEAGNGWYDIISSLCWKIKQHEENKNWKRKNIEANEPEKLKEFLEYCPVKFTQIKEKFGGLRIYFTGGDEYIEGLVSMAESFSYQVCEVCGEKGRPNENGWISTLCENCRTKNSWTPPEFPG